MKMFTFPSVASQTVVCLMLVALLCFGSSAFAQNSTIFGPNVYVFTPSTSVATINSTLTTLAGNAQFSTNRYQIFFEPGTYTGVESEVGYYEAIGGLGETPNAVNISQGYLTANQTDGASCVAPQPAGCMTVNFWRALENMAMTVPTADASTLQWGVSQGAAFRRMDINGGVELADSTCGETSGGFMADSVITGLLNACSQQQWYTRNSSLGSFEGNVWNDVFSGVAGAPAQSNPFSNDELNVQNTVLATTPVVREKPYLYMDGSGNYWVFSPSLRTNSTNTDWSNGGLGAGTSLAISTFLIATPSTSLATINAWLATSGHNLILTPGIYEYSGAIAVTEANTVVLGLGYADIVPQSGTAAVTVADVGGVQLAAFLIDAGPVNSPILLQVGVAGTDTGVSHATNPTSISDVYFRIGGATLGTCTEAEEIDSENVIIDNTWIWRADHGNAGTFGWTANTCKNGLVVNGANVTALGLAVEHFQGEQVVWNGNGGETIFYQSEMPYDVPSQAAWMNGTVDGYASYNVSPSVTSHKAYGLGVYSYFNQGVAIIANSGIAAPDVTGVSFTDSASVWLAGSGQITYNIATNTPGVTDNAGTLVEGPLDTASGPSTNVSDVGSWVGTGTGGGTTTTATPTFSPAAGTYTSAQSVTISDTTSGAKIYYTTNGTTPTTSSTLYSAAITVSATETIEAIAAASGDSNSAVASATYTISSGSSGGSGNFTVKNNCSYTIYPGIYPATYDNGGWTMTAGSSVSFTLAAGWNGRIWGRKGCNTASPAVCTTGSCGGTGLQCAGTTGVAGTSLAEFNLDASGGIDWYDVSYVDGFDNPIGVVISNTSCASPNTCTSGPLTSCNSSLVADGGADCLSPCTATGNAQFCCAGAYDTSALCIVANWPAADQSYVTNIHNDCPNEYAYAYDDPVGLHQCATGSNYTITFCPNGSGSTGGTTTTATPTFSPAAGTYSSAQTVAISDTTSGAKIYYTTNGTTPTTSSTLYSAAITVSATETVEAIAAASGDSNSAVATAAYTISTSGGSTLANGTYTVTPQNATALRLDDSGAKTTTGNPIIVYTSNGTGAQNWVTTNSGVTPAGYYNLATEGAYCMTASGTTSGSAVVLDPCAGTTAQAWEAVASGSFYVLHPGNNTALCLTASGTTSGNAVDVDTCSGATSQEWAF